MSSRFYIAAPQKSSGKTTLSLGLAAALSGLENTVQCFKKGPDYIDPIWLSRASGHATYNLDFNTQSHDEILDCYQRHSVGKDVVLVEGNMGLFDGTAIDGSNSNAAMAKLLNLPVVLIVNCQGISRGIAPLLMGYQQFDSELTYAGVILNQVAGTRHEAKLIQATEQFTDFTVLGSIPRNPDIHIPERHLGLVPANESSTANDTIQALAQQLATQLDLQQLLQQTKSAEIKSTRQSSLVHSSTSDGERITIGVANDSAFGFYYPDDLQAMERQGAEIIYFDTLTDPQLPAVDALFIGGGFPETHMTQLEANSSMRESIRQAIESGMPTYAECGGMMYLCDSIEWHGVKHQMAGVIQADIEMHPVAQGRGYAQLTETESMLWPGSPFQQLPAHEFHYAQLKPKEQLSFAYSITRGYGINGQSDGIVKHNMLANFIHLRNTQSSPWIGRFLTFIRQKVNHER